jgi:hypothetical protein
MFLHICLSPLITVQITNTINIFEIIELSTINVKNLMINVKKLMINVDKYDHSGSNKPKNTAIKICN